MCFLEFSYQTVFIFYKLTGLCVGGKVCEFLCIIYEFPSTKDHAMTYVSSRQSVTTEMWISFWVQLCEIRGGQKGNGKGCHRLLRYFLVIIIPLMLHTHLHLISRMSRWSLGTFIWSSVLSHISGAVDRIIFSYCFFSRQKVSMWALLSSLGNETDGNLKI